MSTPIPEFAVLRERAEQAEARAAEVEAILGAWNAQFGTTQLTHAAERLRVSEARVKELEGLAKAVCSYTPNLPPEKGGNHRYALGMLTGELTALRARVAELEEKAQKFPWELAGKAKRLEQRNAELVAALREAKHELSKIFGEVSQSRSSDIVSAKRALEITESALARAESATPAEEHQFTVLPDADDEEERESAALDHIRDAAQMVPPAKHPDTERLDWLWSEGFLPDWESRAAIDAARKQEGQP